jgi:hypothetical protein
VSTAPAPPPADRRWAVALGLVVVTAAVFAPAVHNDFVGFDDGATVINNPHVRGGVSHDGRQWAGGLTADGVEWAVLAVECGYWHPVTWLSLQLDVTLFGPGPFGFHLTNVILHALNAGVLFLVLRRLTGCTGRSAAVALLWALHPLRVEPVSWVTARKDMLSGLFFFLSLTAYTRYALTESRAWYWLTLGAFALGMATKPMLVTTPFVLLLLDAWPLGRMRSAADLPRLVWEKTPFLVLGVVFSAATVFAAADVGATHSLDTHPVSQRVATALVGYGAYLRLTVWPSGLAAPYLLGPRPPWQPAAGAAVLVAITVLVLMERRRAPYLTVGWLWFVGMLVPVCGLLQSGTQAYADRFTYLPHVGLLIALVWGAADLAERVRVPAAAMGVLVVLLAVGCAVQCERLIPNWRSTRALWERLVAIDPRAPDGWYGLSLVCMEEGQYDEAIRCAEEASRAAPESEAYIVYRLQLPEFIRVRGELKRIRQAKQP